MKLVVADPNFSIIVPGKCNASCDFCCWSRVNELEHDKYKNKLQAALDYLPDSFQQCTITGGEPTLYPRLVSLAKMLRKRFPKIVLSTNGAQLKKKLDVLEHIDHINLSRHHFNEEECRLIFNTSTIPSNQEVRGLCEAANRKGVDVTINAVLPKHHKTRGCGSRVYAENFVLFAKEAGASGIRFRKLIGNLDRHALEKNISFTMDPVYTSKCPVCVTSKYIIDGMPVLFSKSVEEPSEELEGAYEAILHPNGRLTSDWKGETPLELEEDLSEIIGKIRAPNVEIISPGVPVEIAPCSARTTTPRVEVVRSRRRTHPLGGGGCAPIVGGGCGV